MEERVEKPMVSSARLDQLADGDRVFVGCYRTLRGIVEK